MLYTSAQRSQLSGAQGYLRPPPEALGIPVKCRLRQREVCDQGTSSCFASLYAQNKLLFTCLVTKMARIKFVFVISLLRSRFVLKVLAHIKMVLETKEKNIAKMSNNVVTKF